MPIYFCRRIWSYALCKLASRSLFYLELWWEIYLFKGVFSKVILTFWMKAQEELPISSLSYSKTFCCLLVCDTFVCSFLLKYQLPVHWFVYHCCISVVDGWVLVLSLYSTYLCNFTFSAFDMLFMLSKIYCTVTLRRCHGIILHNST